MRITNVKNYPIEYVRAAEAAVFKPKPDTIGVTALIDPPLIRTLTLRHWDDLTIDVSEMQGRLDGIWMHKGLQGAAPEDAKTERFVSSIIQDTKITGCFDLYMDRLLVDHKRTSVWSWIYSRGEEWAQQMNVYLELCTRNGWRIDHMEVHANYHDWDERKLQQDHGGNYPKQPVVVVPIPMWDEGQRLSFIRNRIIDHRNNLERECTPVEKWQKADSYAVKATGRKIALRVLPSEAEAQQWVADNSPKGKITIEKRPGGCTRCEKYCSVRAFCPFYKSHVEE